MYLPILSLIYSMKFTDWIFNGKDLNERSYRLLITYLILILPNVLLGLYLIVLIMF